MHERLGAIARNDVFFRKLPLQFSDLYEVSENFFLLTTSRVVLYFPHTNKSNNKNVDAHRGLTHMHIVRANPIFQSGLMLGAPITNSSSLDLEGLIPGGDPGRSFKAVVVVVVAVVVTAFEI